MGIVFCVVAGFSDGRQSYVIGVSALALIVYGLYTLVKYSRSRN